MFASSDTIIWLLVERKSTCFGMIENIGHTFCCPKNLPTKVKKLSTHFPMDGERSKLSVYLVFTLRQRLQQYQGISHNEHAQDHDPNHGLAGRREGGQRIEYAVGDHARPQGSAAPENDDVQEADEHSEENLHQIFRYPPLHSQTQR